MSVPSLQALGHVRVDGGQVLRTVLMGAWVAVSLFCLMGRHLQAAACTVAPSVDPVSLVVGKVAVDGACGRGVALEAWFFLVPRSWLGRAAAARMGPSRVPGFSRRRPCLLPAPFNGHESLLCNCNQVWAFKVSFSRYNPLVIVRTSISLAHIRWSVQGCLMGSGLSDGVELHFF